MLKYLFSTTQRTTVFLTYREQGTRRGWIISKVTGDSYGIIHLVVQPTRLLITVTDDERPMVTEVTLIGCQHTQHIHRFIIRGMILP